MARPESRGRALAYVGLGSNLADPVTQLRAGIGLLAALAQTRVERCSSFYRTAPVGITQQPDFVNAVCRVETGLEPVPLMHALLDIEQRRGRVRDIPGGPRTLDLDLLLYYAPDGSACQRHAGGLTLPHPRLHERAFVLYPLYELAPELEIPGHGQVAKLLTGCVGQTIEKLAITQ